MRGLHEQESPDRFQRDCPRCGLRNEAAQDPVWGMRPSAANAINYPGAGYRSDAVSTYQRWMPPTQCKQCAADLRGLPLVEAATTLNLGSE